MSFFRKCVFYNLHLHLHTNVKPSLWNIAVFISTKQNGSYVIRQNNIKQKTLCVYYFLIKRKKLFGQPNILTRMMDIVHVLIMYEKICDTISTTEKNIWFRKYSTKMSTMIYYYQTRQISNTRDHSNASTESM